MRLTDAMELNIGKRVRKSAANAPRCIKGPPLLTMRPIVSDKLTKKHIVRRLLY